MKKNIIILFVIIIGLSFVGLSFAEDGIKAKLDNNIEEMGSQLDAKGRNLFGKSCRPCHRADSKIEGAEDAENYTPELKTQAQWIEIFKEEEYKDYQCVEEWTKIGKENLETILSYLYKYAADSGRQQPQKCM